MAARGLQDWQACIPGWSVLRASCVWPPPAWLATAGRELRGQLKLGWRERDLVTTLGELAEVLASRWRRWRLWRRPRPTSSACRSAQSLRETALAFATEPAAENVRWIDVGPQQVRLVESPSTSAAMREQLTPRRAPGLHLGHAG